MACVRLVKLLRTCSGEDDLVDEFLMKQIFIAIDKMHQEAGDPPPAKQPSYRFKKRKRRR